MAKKPKQEEAPAGAPAWMATFSDLMNLLLCFFVLLFSMSSTDTEKFQEVIASIQSSFSIFSSGGTSIGEGQMISSGISQLEMFDDYFNSVHDGDDLHGHDAHHHHHDRGHHHADDIFSTSVLRDIRIHSDTPETFIAKLQSGDFGRILRGKGYIRDVHGNLLYVDVTPADSSYRKATPEKAGDKADIFIVIGCSLDENALQNMI